MADTKIIEQVNQDTFELRQKNNTNLTNVFPKLHKHKYGVEIKQSRTNANLNSEREREGGGGE